MKNLVVTIIVAIFVMASFSQVQAQYAIPSFDVAVVANTTFEDNSWTVNDQNGTREERKLKVRVNTSTSMQATWALVSVYKVGAPFQTQVILVEDGEDFEMNIYDGLWGVIIHDASQYCMLSVWDE